MTARRDMTIKEFELALHNQQFVRSVCGRALSYRSTKAGTDRSMRYFTHRYPTLNRRMAIKDLIRTRHFHERQIRLHPTFRYRPRFVHITPKGPTP